TNASAGQPRPWRGAVTRLSQCSSTVAPAARGKLGLGERRLYGTRGREANRHLVGRYLHARTPVICQPASPLSQTTREVAVVVAADGEFVRVADVARPRIVRPGLLLEPA